MQETEIRPSYIYGPVVSWRSGTSLGIDPIGPVSTCSFNCSYCQLGKIQNITRERKIYVPTADVISDLDAAYQQKAFEINELDIITFAGSGEPTLAANFGEIAFEIKKWLEAKDLNIPLSVLTNATTLDDKNVISALNYFDLISLKLDAVDEISLKSINQAENSLSIEEIKAGIKNLKSISGSNLQLQIMFLPKFAKDEAYLLKMAETIIELGIRKIQINTPNRAKPKSGSEYWLETRGNHYTEASKAEVDESKREYIELPVISKEDAFFIEEFLQSQVRDKIGELAVINVYRK
ncbi:MAG: radical SAM protein [Candidatus Caenarcaniphilales bacterium]|nr:radical SAM protein [Candidatus Caenarcaniphilales bacterium]